LQNTDLKGRGAVYKNVVAHILGCRRSLIPLQVIQGIWICGFLSGVSLKDADFQKTVAPFPPKQSPFSLNPINRGLFQVLTSEKIPVLASIRDVQTPHCISWPLQENIHATYALALNFSAISLPVWGG